jgi:glucosamine kinase
VRERLSELLDGFGDVRPQACCAGAAGAEVATARSHLQDMLQRRLPGSRIRVVHDTRLVLAAAGVDAGIALIAGTGAVAYARTADGHEVQRGGWGWMLGDEGSGVWIAREAARLVLARLEEGAPGGTLAEALVARCETDDPRQLIAMMHSMREPMQWAALADVVFESADADAGAGDIIDRAASSLAQLVVPLRRLADGPVVLAGGLLLNQPLLEDGVRRRLGTSCIRLEQPPVEGAVRLAAELLP